jgi:Kef-type K+ transport system membrane component KefB
MNQLASLGLILLFALLIGHVVKFVRIPEVTGYLLAGMIVGPSVLGWVTHENLQALHVFSEVGLGLILFSIGAVFELSRMRQIGRKVVTVAMMESAASCLVVAIAMLALGQPIAVAALLGAIAVSTGAASTLMVIRESNSAGPFTDAVTSVIGLNNIIALIVFSLVASALDLSSLGSVSDWSLTALARAVFPLFWELIGSVALGYLVGILLASWASQVVESGEVLILLVGCVLLTVGAATIMGLSPLVSSLAVGATMANLSSRSRKLFDALSRTDPPLYVIFFVLAGADLDLSLLPTLGVLGGTYVVARAVGKLGGSWYGARRVGLGRAVERLFGFSILAQAGLAVGLVLITRERFPEVAPTVTTVVLGAVIVFELTGPLSARIAFARSGESRPQLMDELLPLEEANSETRLP